MGDDTTIDDAMTSTEANTVTDKAKAVAKAKPAEPPEDIEALFGEEEIRFALFGEEENREEAEKLKAQEEAEKQKAEKRAAERQQTTPVLRQR